ncbi:coiled-coil domain containing 92B [Amblyraja radiata]|uniref:coiled-coil domain containing 92B n=1 Tax=Amblyraja radiata TaxID=386614 RepID=UPI0014023BF7|nr:coiled-coil domain containing 92B [Amblyraja radiata]
METSSLERQLQSVQRNVAFLKGEHMELLHGLHMEILQLQKRCTELTCELTEKSSKHDPSAAESEVVLDCGPLEQLLQEREQRNTALRRELQRKESLIGALEGSMRRRERLFLDELKRRSHRMAVLSSELQRQSEAAAGLTLQLHNVKLRLGVSRPPDLPPDRAIPSSPVYTLKKTHKLHCRAPATVCGNSGGGSRAPGRSCNQQRNLPGWDAMPDPALFLQARRHHPHPQPHPHLQPRPHPSISDHSSWKPPRTPTQGASKPLDLLGPPADTEIPLTDDDSNGEDPQK